MGESVQTHRTVPPTWVKTLIAPLLVVSLGLHGLLLLAPVPSRPVTEAEEDSQPEEEFVDLLSIGTLPVAEPEPELPETAPPPESAPPPAQATAPTAPTQPLIPAAYPDTSPPDPSLADAPTPAEPAFTAEPQPSPPATFIQEEEVVEIFTRLTRGSGDSDFDSTETAFPYAAYATRQGIGEWSAAEQACFFTEISAESYVPHANVVSLRYLTRNVQFIESQDIPRTFPAPEFQINNLSGGYCGRPLFEILKGGQSSLFISVVGVGVGARGQQASGLVIIWSRDPRIG
ncbi:MAG TPA: hypothetical protein IGR64_08395 [Leptolyngbyaceae cyanobacterium M65_K2018_010]|nr:hypothetical protein [Leptolyngbyaceae cyanobacterium M65_K2018_010]